VSNAGKSRSLKTSDAAAGALSLREALFQEQDAYGLIVTDGNGTITDWNPAATGMYGYSREEAIGQTTSLIRVPADAARVPNEITAAMARDGRWSGEIAFKRKDGTVGISDTVIFAFLDETGDPATIGINRDISERQRTQEALRESAKSLRMITDNLPGHFAYLDAGLRYRYVNDQVKDLLAMSREEIIGKHVREILDAATYRDLEPYLRRALGGEQVTFEQQRTSADGAMREYESTYLPHFGDDGQVLGCYVMSVDITERRRAEYSMHVAMEEAEQANQSKSEFLANMSHELRTPLNAINGFSEMIFSEALGPLGNVEYQKYAGYIKEAGQHLLDLINDLLDISRIEAGKVELAEETVDVAALVRSCIAMVRERADAADVQVYVDVDEELLPLLRADGTRMRQIMLNLLSNAVKFTPSDGTVTVRAWYHIDRGFVLQVADTGIGIAADNIPKALTRFGQVESTLDRSYEGTGLGLPLTKSLVEQHGGTLDLQSQVGIGTVVTVNLPAKRAIRPAA
jgi:PAS domain S-box-containing protein